MELDRQTRNGLPDAEVSCSVDYKFETLCPETSGRRNAE